MRRIFTALIIISTLFLFKYLFFRPHFPLREENNKADFSDYKISNLTINERQLRLLVADSSEKQKKGLMFIERPLSDIDGMLFPFPELRQASFWNKNTFLDLNVLWLSGDKVVGESFLPSFLRDNIVHVIHSPEPVDGVIELFLQDPKN